MENNITNTKDEFNKKILFVFDMDHTILQDNSDIVILDLLSQEARVKIESKMRGSENWASLMQEVYKLMKLENIPLSKVKEAILNISFTKGFNELFDFIKQNKGRIESIIVSGANTLFIEWILEHYQMKDIIPKYYSNIAKEHEELLIEIKQSHEHQCETCDKAQCKEIILRDYLKEINYESGEYKHVLYAGDGANDYCPATVLGENDFLFPRENYPLYNKLYKKNFARNLKCKIIAWKTGFEILDQLKKLI